MGYVRERSGCSKKNTVVQLVGAIQRCQIPSLRVSTYENDHVTLPSRIIHTAFSGKPLDCTAASESSAAHAPSSGYTPAAAASEAPAPPEAADSPASGAPAHSSTADGCPVNGVL